MSVEPGTPGSFFYVLEDAVRILFVDDVAAETFDIMLLDLEMPNMDGFEVLARLRADERTRRMPVIVVTGREDVFAIDKAFQAGATSFLVKPINWRLLSYQVRYVHRTAESQMALVRQRTQARMEAHRATDALKQLAVQGASLLREAMHGPPELRRMAKDYVALLEGAAGSVKIEEDEVRRA
jgi:DNA-binding response OmpR family regulator